MVSPILWQSNSQMVTLLDIPRSISAAQGTLQQPCHDHLLSVKPLLAPFPSNEPKSAKARARLQTSIADQQLHEQYAALLESALTQVRQEYEGSWCLPRPFLSEPPRSVIKKRKRLQDQDDASKVEPFSLAGEKGDDHQKSALSLPNDLLSSLAQTSPDEAKPYSMQLLSLPSSPIMTDSISSVNIDSSSTYLGIYRRDDEQSQQSPWYFRIPRASKFVLGDCAQPEVLHESLASSMPFDFVLLDPPWPSRSVKRTHKTAGSTYATVTTLHGVREMLESMRLEGLLVEDGMIGIWITNKPAIRELVLELFASLGVELAEEWIWLKTTVYGEPVTEVVGLWRKPYEVLLLARRRSSSSPSPCLDAEEVRRRVIIGVPDLHSRKPCLKSLIEPMLSDPTDYRALEIFARYLVAGWCSWGDECIKFNWDGYWRNTVTTSTLPPTAEP